MVKLLLSLTAAACLNAEFLEIRQTFGGEACKSCEASLEKGLARMKGVSAVRIDTSRGVAHLTLEPGNTIRLSTIRDRIKGVGFKPGTAEVTLNARIDGVNAVVEPSGEGFTLSAKPESSGTIRGTIDIAAAPGEKQIIQLSNGR